MREGEIYRERESRRKIGVLRGGDTPRTRETGAHLAFIITLCFRENIFLIFEESRGKVEGEAEAIKGEEKRTSGISKNGKKGEGHTENEKYGVFFFEENIFFICKLMREIAIITEATTRDRY